ncbi:MAG: porin family protein [Sphingomonas sp.]|uniref:outer membrane protein n=1 Tax=Sphingomonas sp. TaxID=28214 RepID=UPI0025CC8609|nr:outer membrane beta-barrel protein [Sphingomonas sp.]MBX3563160.1 porin family protein [Sphingomonas sp.]
MRFKFIAAALIASSALSAPAFAQDAAPFTGPRAEAVVGWDRVEDSAANGGHRDGVVYGGQIGYDFQAGSAVIGVEGEATGATTRARDTSVLVAGDSLRVKAGRDLYVGARVGFTVGDKALIYAKGGYTNAGFNTRYTTGTTTVTSKDNADGWRLGAGAEVKLTDKIYAKAEYRYSKYDDNSSGVDAKRHQVLGGVGVRF